VDAPTPVELTNAKHPRRRNVVEACDYLQGARFPDRHALGVTRRNMGPVKFADVLSELEQFSLVAAESIPRPDLPA
jgi:hypothetical protein